ncbi:MAG: MerR family transcriptional regulator, partial [Treponema sp.]|nr:MerR family transcriptional regulator [Treponema sp.]
VAEKYKLSQDSLRYYERIGLIPPVNRTRGGIRDYTDEDERWVEFMTCMRSAGLSIESLVEYVALFRKGDHTKDARKQLLIDQRRALAARVAELQSTLDRLDAKIARYDEGLAVREAELR